MQDLVCKVFDDCSDHYATERETLPYFQAQLRIAFSMLAAETPGRILSLGCAAGAEIPELRARGFQVLGFDLSERMARLCRTRFASDRGVQVCCAEAEHLPLADASADQVICLGVFEFLQDHSSGLAEVARVLKPGGLAIIALPSRISLYNVTYQTVYHTLGAAKRTLKSIAGKKPSLRAGVNRNLCIPWKFRALLRSHGLIPERSAYSNYFVYPLDRYPALDVKVAAALEPLASKPILKMGASVFLVSSRKSI